MGCRIHSQGMQGAFTIRVTQFFQYPLKTQMLPHFTNEITEAQSTYVILPGHRGSSHRTETQNQVRQAMKSVVFPVPRAT